MQREMRQDMKRTHRFSSPEIRDSDGLVTELNFWPRSKQHRFKLRRMCTWTPFSNWSDSTGSSFIEKLVLSNSDENSDRFCTSIFHYRF